MAFTRIPVHTNPHYHRSGRKSYVHLMRKYKFTPTLGGPFHKSKTGHHELVKKSADGTSGSVPATDVQNDSQYLASVKIGTPGISMALDFDTGSSDLWLWSTKLPANVQSNKPAGSIFDPSNSKTYKVMSGSKWKIQYGDGSTASGIVGTDNINLGGLIIKNQAIELADTLSAQFQQDSSYGLLGLAWPSLNTVSPTPVSPPVQNLIDQKDISASEELFTAYLGSWRDANDPDKGQSFYTFGYIDQDVISASGQQISYTPVDNSQGFWQFSSATATVNGQTVTPTTSDGSPNTAIADTGTTLALVSDEVVKAIYAAIPGSKYDSTQQGYVYPSSTTVDQLPVVTVAVGNNQFTIEKEQLGFADAGNGMVYGAFQSRGQQNFDILGDVFLKCVYAIFDVGNQQFGCVPRIEPTQNTAPPPSQ